MNFSYLKNRAEFEFLYNACREAEQFALSRPDVAALSARRAMEWIVKYIYAEVEPYPPYGCTVYDMTQDARFREQFANPAMLESIDLIRRIGNAAAHRGSLNAEDAVLALEQLHYLAGEFAVGIGLIDDYAPFAQPDPMREAMERVHPDNLTLNLLPYLRADGHADWAMAMINARERHLNELYDAPEELRSDEFIEYLGKYERSRKAEVEEILQLLPLSSATEREWEERRRSVSPEAIGKIELYVQAYMEDHPEGKTVKHIYYVQSLGEKARAYLWLVHPEYVPESMRSAYVIPDGGEIGDADEYMPLEDALKQLLRYYAAGNPRRCELLSNRGWCKTHFGTEMTIFKTSRDADHKEMYSEERIHVGNRKYAVYLKWEKNSLLYLRQQTGELGEKIITMDRMADWGFAMPGSEAEKRAKLRAEKRAAEEQRRAAETETEKQEVKPTKKEEADPEFSPRGIREYLQMDVNLFACMEELCSPTWSMKQFGFRHPILIESEEGLYLRRKQMDRNYSYSPLQMQYAGKSYLIHRMKVSEFERFKKIAQKMQWTSMRL